jgi:hypothetical protein
MTISGDDDERSPHRYRSKRQRTEDTALHLQQINGGELEDAMAEAVEHEPDYQKAYNDGDLLAAGFRETAQHNYTDLDGKLLYQVVRYEHASVKGAKIFRQRRPDPDGRWLASAGLVRVPYRWRALATRTAEDVFYCEGEKNADLLCDKGLLASTSASQKWTRTIAGAYANRNVYVLADADDAGEKNALKAERWLRGVNATVRIVRLPGLLHSEDVHDWLTKHGHSVEELIEICRQTPVEGRIAARPHDFPAEETIPMWDFLYGKHLLRGTVSGTAAMGNTGKSSIAIIEALAMTSTKPLLGIGPPRPLCVVLINLEDDRNTMDKRIAAAMRHHGLTKEEIGDRLIVIARGEKTKLKIKVAKQLRSGDVERNETVIKALTNLMIEHRADVLSIDSFIRTHKVHENDNSAVEEVVECFEDVATAANCAVHLWHHTRKENDQGASLDSARGAKAFVDACRSVRIMETITKEAAEKLKIEHRGFYFRSFFGKRNFAPPLDESDWFKFVNVELNNNPPLFGDDVGVVERWQFPSAQQANLSPGTIASIMERVGREPRWRNYSTADMWVGKAVAEVLGLDAEDDVIVVKAAVKKLKKMGALREVIGRDAGRREDKSFVVAGSQTAPGFGSATRERVRNERNP